MISEALRTAGPRQRQLSSACLLAGGPHLETLFIAKGKVLIKWYSSFGKQFGSFLRMLSIVLLCDPKISFLALYSRDMEIYVDTETCMKMFVAALFLIAKGGNNLNALSIN